MNLDKLDGLIIKKARWLKKMEHIDLQTERYIINRFISIPKLFDSLGIDYRINANMFCP